MKKSSLATTTGHPTPGCDAGQTARADGGDLSLDELMCSAYAMEVAAAERYTQMAAMMKPGGNVEVAALFDTLARIERLHSRYVLDSMGWKKPPEVAGGGRPWRDGDAAETVDDRLVHPLMQASDALLLALKAEQRAQCYFEWLAGRAATPEVHAAALKLARDEAEHVQLVEELLKRMQLPRTGEAAGSKPPRLEE